MNKFLLISLLTLMTNFGSSQDVFQHPNYCPKYNNAIKNVVESNPIKSVNTFANDFELGFKYNGVSIFELGGFENIYNSLGKDNHNNFKMESHRKALTGANDYILKFQHYYKNTKVEGSGFSMMIKKDNIDYIAGPCIDCPPPVEPCDLVYMFTPFVYNDIDLNVNNNLDVSQISTILNTNVTNINTFDKEIKVLSNDACQYKLVYKVLYYKDGNKISWIDANSHVIISTINQGYNLNAPVEKYGTNGIVNLNDKTVNGITKLISNDNKVSTYNFNLADFDETFKSVSVSDYSINKIPQTTSIEWTESVASKSTYQAHYVGVECRDAFQQYLGFNFSNLHIGANLSGGAAGVPLNFKSYFTDAYILVGSDNGNSMAVFDVFAHEMGHIVLYELGLSYTNNDNKLLHEGISDMIGVYIASKIKGNVNWHLAQDVPYKFGRNLQNPSFDCLSTNYMSSGHLSHSWAQAIGHFYYLLSEGTVDIDKVGMEKTLKIILDAVNSLSATPTLEQFIEMTVKIADKELGVCPGGVAFRRAWDKIICESLNISDPNNQFLKISQIISGYKKYSCNFAINGMKDYYCEESNLLYLCAGNDFPGVSTSQFTWTILGKYGSDFSITGNSNNSNYHTGSCLHITKFPDFPYYPQIVTIELHVPGYGTKKFNIKIIDCDGDDPTCNDYFSIISNRNKNSLAEVNKSRTKISISPNPSLGDFNVLLTDLSDSEIVYKIINQNGILISEQNISVNNNLKEHSIHIDDLINQNTGLYFVQFNTSSMNKTFKILKY